MPEFSGDPGTQYQDYAAERHWETHGRLGGDPLEFYAEYDAKMADLDAIDTAHTATLGDHETRITDLETSDADHETRIATLEAQAEVIVYQAAPQQLTSNSTVMQAITGFKLPLLASQVWRFSVTLLFLCSAAADFKFQFVVPAGASLVFSTGPVVFGAATVQYASIAAAAVVNADGNAANTGIEISGTVTCGATPGDLQLQAAQNVATVEITDVVSAGSNLVAKRVH